MTLLVGSAFCQNEPIEKEIVTKFTYLSLDYNSAFGRGFKIAIDSAGHIVYAKSPEITVDGKIKSRIAGEFSKKEFRRFLNLLANSSPSKLVNDRGGCEIDASPQYFKISFNNKIISSEGCSLNDTQKLLFNYLQALTKNKGFINRKKE